MKFLAHIFRIIITTILISAILYYFSPQFRTAIDQKYEWLFPCRTPITYSIGSVDQKFGISKEDFLKAVQAGEKTWEDALRGKNLFEHTPTGGKIVVNLIYDTRQESTTKLKKLGYNITNDKAGFDNLKLRYDSLKTSYDRDKNQLTSDISILKNDQNSFEKEVSYWNEKGGAPKSDYNRLEAEKVELNARAATLEQKQAALNQEADTINSLATVLNEQIQNLNLDVAKYNDNQQTLGDEFDQGEYVLDETGRSINIYQFDNKAKLERVLAHELGHAIGLDHNNNPKSVMYKIDQGTTLTLSLEDVSALKAVCRI